MSDRPFEQPVFPDIAPDAADPGEGAPGAREDVEEHLATDTAGESPEEAGDLDGADLAEELRGRADPPFRTPHPGHDPS